MIAARFHTHWRCTLTVLLMMATHVIGRGLARPDESTNDRYVAVLRDGTVIRGSSLQEWNRPNASPALDGQPLFAEDNPLVVLYQSRLESRLTGSYVRLANGDVISGRVVRASKWYRYGGEGEFLTVVPTGPLIPTTTGDTAIHIRREFVTAIVGDGPADQALQPGTLVLADGRSFRVSSIRWEESGVVGLADDQIVQVRWSDIAQIRPPANQVIDRVDALLADARFPRDDHRSMIGRIQTESGSVITFRRSMVYMENERSRGLCHSIQPVWSVDPVSVPISTIVWRSYRRPTQIPVSLLRVKHATTRSLTGFSWDWQLDASIHSTSLGVGPLVSDLGIGTHAFSDIEFQLPPKVVGVSAWVGMDPSVGNGGCATCEVTANGKSVWRRDHLRGQDGARRVEVPLKEPTDLGFRTDYGHDGRPAGADVLDIRDQVNWLSPMVELDESFVFPPARQPTTLEHEMPYLAGWKLDEADRERVVFEWHWSRISNRWTRLIRWKQGRVNVQAFDRFVLRRKVAVSESLGWLTIRAGRDGSGGVGHRVRVEVNGEDFNSIMNGDVTTTSATNRFGHRNWSLGSFAGQEIELAIVLTGHGSDHQIVSGVIIDECSLQPLVRGLPTGGRIIKPQVRIESLTPVESSVADDMLITPQPDTPRSSLTIHGFPISTGFGFRCGNAITYQLDPSWRRFVAVIGLCDGWQGVGPYSVLLDGKHVWSNAKPVSMGRYEPARQISVDIPQGHKTITLALEGPSKSCGAWGNAGFLRE